MKKNLLFIMIFFPQIIFSQVNYKLRMSPEELSKYTNRFLIKSNLKESNIVFFKDENCREKISIDSINDFMLSRYPDTSFNSRREFALHWANTIIVYNRTFLLCHFDERRNQLYKMVHISNMDVNLKRNNSLSTLLSLCKSYSIDFKDSIVELYDAKVYSNILKMSALKAFDNNFPDNDTLINSLNFDLVSYFFTVEIKGSENSGISLLLNISEVGILVFPNISFDNGNLTFKEYPIEFQNWPMTEDYYAFFIEIAKIKCIDTLYLESID